MSETTALGQVIQSLRDAVGQVGLVLAVVTVVVAVLVQIGTWLGLLAPHAGRDGGGTGAGEGDGGDSDGGGGDGGGD